MTGRVLTIAESDSSGIIGVQADIKTVLALGGYATSAITAITTQSSTKGASEFQIIDPLLVAEQMRSVLDGIGTDAIKTGTLNNSVTVEAVADVINKHAPRDVPVIVDPSLAGRDGCLLVDETTVAAVKRHLLLRATVLTASLREAEYLTGMTLRDLDQMRHAAMLRTLGAETVVLRCSQVVSAHELYFVATEDVETVFECPHVPAGQVPAACATLASAIAVGMGQGLDVLDAITRALNFMYQALLQARPFADGCGMLNHAFAVALKHDIATPGVVVRRDF